MMQLLNGIRDTLLNHRLEYDARLRAEEQASYSE